MTRKYTRCFLMVVLIIFTLLFLGCTQTSDSHHGVKDKEANVSTNSVSQTLNNTKMPVNQLELLPQEIQRIKARGKLVVARFEEDRPPFFYRNNNGELAGIDVSLARDIAQSLGVGSDIGCLL